MIATEPPMVGFLMIPSCSSWLITSSAGPKIGGISSNNSSTLVLGRPPLVPFNRLALARAADVVSPPNFPSNLAAFVDFFINVPKLLPAGQHNPSAWFWQCLD
jgi:hypothetical protein